MTAEKKKQAQLLTLLMVVLAGVGYYEYQSIFPSAPTAATSPAAKVAHVTQLIPATGNATRILQDLINDKSNQGVVGRRNVFQYYVPPPPPKPAPPPAAPPVVQRQQAPSNPAPPAAPPLPFSALSNFQYDGIIIQPKPGKLVATIDDKTNHYSVSEGDYILGRYRINRLTETSVEIEDTEQNRRQTYTRIPKL